jgi:protein-S-isoprenylcysteine O-methyltransferase Ste14
MYVGVVIAALGLAAVHASRAAALYACSLFLAFHFVVVFIEEPHLKARDPKAFAEYSERVPRWLGLPSKS